MLGGQTMMYVCRSLHCGSLDPPDPDACSGGFIRRSRLAHLQFVPGHLNMSGPQFSAIDDTRQRIPVGALEPRGWVHEDGAATISEPVVRFSNSRPG